MMEDQLPLVLFGIALKLGFGVVLNGAGVIFGLWVAHRRGWLR